MSYRTTLLAKSDCIYRMIWAIYCMDWRNRRLCRSTSASAAVFVWYIMNQNSSSLIPHSVNVVPKVTVTRLDCIAGRPWSASADPDIHTATSHTMSYRRLRQAETDINRVCSSSSIVSSIHAIRSLNNTTGIKATHTPSTSSPHVTHRSTHALGPHPPTSPRARAILQRQPRQPLSPRSRKHSSPRRAGQCRPWPGESGGRCECAD